jgi:hypothetical protein
MTRDARRIRLLRRRTAVGLAGGERDIGASLLGVSM